MVAGNRRTGTLCFPNPNGRIATPLMGWHGVANNSFRAGGTVTACRVHESFPGEKHMGDVTHQFPELEHQP